MFFDVRYGTSVYRGQKEVRVNRRARVAFIDVICERFYSTPRGVRIRGDETSDIVGVGMGVESKVVIEEEMEQLSIVV
jgi:hypothetical protein